MLILARILALPVSLNLIWRLSTDAAYREGNIFLVPDLSFSILLVAAALMPRRLAVPLLSVGFYLGAGVVFVAGFDRLDQGQTGAAAVDYAIAAVYLAAAVGLSLPGWRRRA
ncbi:hypothetical protein [Glycomyces sp. NPDC048151]|uniref:hypothetical protein n=1 Tax=Glycomyces sp. NPDC048151 TaxID=3364002 RepID=UPI0037209901